MLSCDGLTVGRCNQLSHGADICIIKYATYVWTLVSRFGVLLLEELPVCLRQSEGSLYTLSLTFDLCSFFSKCSIGLLSSAFKTFRNDRPSFAPLRSSERFEL